MSFFLPRECPSCERIVSPDAQPRVGDLAVCPTCRAVMAFTKDLLVRLATPSERIRATISATESEA